MADGSAAEQPPTYYANWVTLTVNTDELVIELRRIDRPHRETASMPVIPGAKPEEVLLRDPIARVVMTYTAAKSLREYLNNTMPRVEASRKTGEPLK